MKCILKLGENFKNSLFQNGIAYNEIETLLDDIENTVLEGINDDDGEFVYVFFKGVDCFGIYGELEENKEVLRLNILAKVLKNK